MAGGYLYGWYAAASKWVKMQCDASGFLKVDPSELFENPPVEDQAKKGPSSEWAFDHKAAVSAHHARYTDGEALAACKLAGTLYWSCLGIDFTCSFPDRQYISYYGAGYILINEDDVQVIVGVSLPHGATIQSCIVLGNNAAKAETWLLRRVNISDLTAVTIGGNNINTIDNVLAYNVVDNNLYGYIIYTSTMDINDIIKGVKITYTL